MTNLSLAERPTPPAAEQSLTAFRPTWREEPKPRPRRAPVRHDIVVSEPCYSLQDPPLAMGCGLCGHPPYAHGCDVVGEHPYKVPSGRQMAERLSLYRARDRHHRHISQAAWNPHGHPCAPLAADKATAVTAERCEDSQAERTDELLVEAAVPSASVELVVPAPRADESAAPTLGSQGHMFALCRTSETLPPPHSTTWRRLRDKARRWARAEHGPGAAVPVRRTAGQVARPLPAPGERCGVVAGGAGLDVSDRGARASVAGALSASRVAGRGHAGATGGRSGRSRWRPPGRRASVDRVRRRRGDPCRGAPPDSPPARPGLTPPEPLGISPQDHGRVEVVPTCSGVIT